MNDHILIIDIGNTNIVFAVAQNSDVLAHWRYETSYNEGVQTFWKKGADIAKGKYLNIDSDCRIVHIITPYDDRLIELGQKLNSTYIAYGYEGETLKQRQAELEAIKKCRFDTIAVHGLYSSNEALNFNQGSVIEPIYRSSK